MSEQKAYPEYKDSGVEWLSKVPAGWEVRKIKSMASLVTSKATERAFPVALENVEGWSGRLLESEADLAGEGVSFIPGDILFGKLRPYLAKVWLADRSGEAVGDFHVMRTERSTDSRFLQYCMLTVPFISLVDGSTYGAKMPRAGWDFIRNVEWSLPPVTEQRAIASFLDRETAEIDAFIVDQEELVELLNERRAATSTRAVTKGLDMNVEMRDSGVPWIGRVPEHWVVDKGTRIGKVFGSEMIREDDINEVSGTQFLKVSSLSIEGFSLQPTRWFVDRYAVAPLTDFIVFPKRGAAIFTNKVNIVKEPALLDPNLMGWKPYKGCDSKFFAYVLQLIKLEEIADVSTVPQINTKHIASLRLPKPSLAEQQQIVDYLDYETSEIDAAIADAKEAIELSKERRAALISAAVTGKIDVRNYGTAELGAA